jgi:hypothetical protein
MMAVLVSPGVAAATISQGYQADQPLRAGTLVSSQTGSSKAVAADSANASALLGVVVDKDGASVAVSAPNDQIQVATSGVATVFISDLGGEVKAGDPISASPIQGVGMRVAEAGKIIGIAERDATLGSQAVAVTDGEGKVTQAKLGSVPVVLQVAYYTPPPEKNVVPQFLQTFVNSLAGKPVSLLRLLGSVVLVLIGTVAVAVLLFSAVRNTMISIGRNPLARNSIYRSLWQVIAASLVMFMAAMGSAYLVLTG